MLRLHNVTVTNADKVLIDSVSFTAYPGEKIGIVGASGSGKSILAHAMMGSVPDDFFLHGCISSKEKFALIPQSGGCLNPHYTVGFQLKHWAVSKDIFLSALGECGLEFELLDKYPGELSGGMMKRVLIALGMIQDAGVLIADEPTVGLEGYSSGVLMHTIANASSIVFIISHDIAELVKHVDRLLVFSEGRLVEDLYTHALAKGFCNDYTWQLWTAAPENWEDTYAKSA